MPNLNPEDPGAGVPKERPRAEVFCGAPNVKPVLAVVVAVPNVEPTLPVAVPTVLNNGFVGVPNKLGVCCILEPNPDDPPIVLFNEVPNSVFAEVWVGLKVVQ